MEEADPVSANRQPPQGQRDGGEMRALLALISALMFLELFFFAVLSPLLPGLKQELAISTSQAGILVAAYALGALAGAIPATLLAVRAGARTTALGSLAVFGVMSIAFGVAKSYDALLAARFIQGVAGAGCWTAAMVWLLETAPVERRGELLGYAFGVSEAGAIAGPAIGGVAASAGRGWVFGSVAAVSIVLAFATTRFASPPQPPRSERRLQLRTILSSSTVRNAMWIAILPAIVLAAVSVLAPLRQHQLGAGATEIALTFAAAALVGIVVRPFFGRWSDRTGPGTPIRVALIASVPIVLVIPWVNSRWALALLVIGALTVTGLMWAPLMVMLSDACSAAGVSQIMAVTVMDLTWPPGNALGSSGGAAIAQAAGERVAYAVIGAGLLAGVLALPRGAARVPPPLTTPQAGA
jgi:DHA1 family inner membrane transport protein